MSSSLFPHLVSAPATHAQLISRKRWQKLSLKVIINKLCEREKGLNLQKLIMANSAPDLPLLFSWNKILLNLRNADNVPFLQSFQKRSKSSSANIRSLRVTFCYQLYFFVLLLLILSIYLLQVLYICFFCHVTIASSF